jgi:hypothetical protein
MHINKGWCSMSKIVSEKIQEFINKNLNEDFFNKNIPNQMSAYRILDVTVSVNGMDEELYRQIPQDKKKQLEEENKIVENEEDINKLYNMLRKGLIPRTVAIIAGKLMKHKDETVPRMLEDLKRSGNDNFIESAARILVKAEDNYANEIAEILPHIKYPYTQAVACYVIGKIGGEDNIELLYKYYNSFKKNYINEAYYEGPLVGLYELKRRYEF